MTGAPPILVECGRPWPHDHGDVEPCCLLAGHAGACAFWTAHRRDRGEGRGVDWRLVAIDDRSQVLLDVLVGDRPNAFRVHAGVWYAEHAAGIADLDRGSR